MSATGKNGVNTVSLSEDPTFNGGMHARAWTRCLARDTEFDGWCQRRPSDGVFCIKHTWEFRCDEAARAATRLAHAQLILRNPSTTPLRRWWATLEVRRARSLRRSLLTKIDRSEDINAGLALSPQTDANRANVWPRTVDLDVGSAASAPPTLEWKSPGPRRDQFANRARAPRALTIELNFWRRLQERYRHLP